MNPVIIHNVYQCMKDCCSLRTSQTQLIRIVKYRWNELSRIILPALQTETERCHYCQDQRKYLAYTDDLMNIPGFFYDKKRGKLSFYRA